MLTEQLLFVNNDNNNNNNNLFLHRYLHVTLCVKIIKTFLCCTGILEFFLNVSLNSVTKILQ